MSTTEFVELFHLIFLFHLGKKLDKNLYALKGGCNLRFYFKSIRYSEDIDLDIQKIQQSTLEHKIDKILQSSAFQQNLQGRGLEIIQFTKPKQTNTTQRWKVSLRAEGHALPLPTKIEFSRREMHQNFTFEPIDPLMVSHYKLYPVLLNHYSLQAAFEQKIQALIHRNETQARDIFDLKLLLDCGATTKNLSNDTKENLDVGIENVMNIGFPEFKSQVISYLMPEYQYYYNSDSVWQKIQESVIKALEDG